MSYYHEARDAKKALKTNTEENKRKSERRAEALTAQVTEAQRGSPPVRLCSWQWMRRACVFGSAASPSAPGLPPPPEAHLHETTLKPRTSAWLPDQT